MLFFLRQIPTSSLCRFENHQFNIRMQQIKGKGFLLVSKDTASRGFDLPQTSHIYNFDHPKIVTDYFHREQERSVQSFSKSECSVTILITEEQFVLQSFHNELKFHSQQLSLE
uniref:Helicase C-terminal domain-containing protein n=1 Tax=Triticum urartu TaxID=4572 RepID=A0A8R7U1H2_TRIUA